MNNDLLSSNFIDNAANSLKKELLQGMTPSDILNGTVIKLPKAKKDSEGDKLNSLIQAINDTRDTEELSDRDKATKEAAKEIKDIYQNTSLYELQRQQQETEIRQKFDQLIANTTDEAEKQRYFIEYQNELNKLTQARELEKQGILPQQQFNWNPYNPYATSFSKREQKAFDANSTFQQKREWASKTVNKKILDAQNYVEGEIELVDGDSGVIKGFLGDTPIRFNSMNRFGEKNGIYDAIDSWEAAISNPQKYTTQSQLVRQVLGIDDQQVVDKENWEAVKAYLNYLIVKNYKGQLKTIDDYESFNINNLEKYKQYFEQNKVFKTRYKKLGKDVYGRELVDVIDENNESPVIGLTFNPLLNAAFRVDKTSRYIESTLKINSTLYEIQKQTELRVKQELQDKKDKDGWFGEKLDMFQARAAQLFGSLPAMFDITENFMSKYVLGKGAGAWREYITNNNELNYDFGVKASTALDFQRDMEEASNAFARGDYLTAATLYGTNVANLIVTSAPDMLAGVGMTAALATVAPALGVSTVTGGNILGLFGRAYIAGSVVSGTAQTVADMHDFEVKHGRQMNDQEMFRTWSMNGLSYALEYLLGGGQLGRLIPKASPYLLATPRQLIKRTGMHLGVNVIEEAGTEAIQEYIQNAVSAANVAGNDYWNSLAREFSDWKTHGAEALAGAITGGVMSGISHVPEILRLKTDIANVRDWKKALSNHGIDLIDHWLDDKWLETSKEFTPEMIGKSNEVKKQYFAHLKTFEDAILADKLNQNIKDVLSSIEQTFAKNKHLMTAQDFLEAKKTTLSLEQLTLSYYLNKAHQALDQNMGKAILVEAYNYLFGKTVTNYDNETLINIAKQLNNYFQSTILGSSRWGRAYYENVGKDQNVKFVSISNDVQLEEGEYKVYKRLWESLNNFGKEMTDADFRAAFNKEIKTTQDVHSDFLWFSQEGHSLTQLMHDMAISHEAFEDIKNRLDKLLQSLPVTQIAVAGGQNAITVTSLLEGVKNQQKDYIDFVEQWSKTNPLLNELVVMGNGVMQDFEKSLLRFRNLALHQTTKAQVLGEGLKNNTQNSVTISWRGVQGIIGKGSDLTIKIENLAKEDSDINKVLDNILTESSIALTELESAIVDQNFFSQQEADALLQITVIPWKANLNDAIENIRQAREDAKLMAQGIQPNKVKCAENSKPALKYWVKCCYTGVQGQTNPIIEKYAYDFLKVTKNSHFAKLTKKKFKDIDSSDRAKMRIYFMNLSDKDLLTKDGKEILNTEMTPPMSFKTIKDKIRVTTQFCSAIQSANNNGDNNLASLLLTYFSAKAIAGQNQDNLHYLQNNAVDIKKINIKDVFGQTFAFDIRAVWLAMTEEQRKEAYALLTMAVEKNNLVPTAANQMNGADLNDSPSESNYKNVLYQWKTIIDTDAFLNTIKDPNNPFKYHYNSDFSVYTSISDEMVEAKFDNKDFPKAKETEVPHRGNILAWLRYLIASGSNVVSEYKVNGQTCYKISASFWNQIMANGCVLTYEHKPNAKDQYSACPMYQGVLNLVSLNTTDAYIFRVAEPTDNMNDIVYADVKNKGELKQDTSGDYLAIDENHKLSFRNDGLVVTFTKQDGTKINVQFAEAVLLCHEFTDGTNGLSILENLDPNDKDLANTIRVKYEELSKGKTFLGYRFNNETFSQQDTNEHKTVFLDYLYLQALKDSNINLQQELGSAKYVFTINESYAEAEIIARALAINKSGKKVTTKQELIDTYGVADKDKGSTGDILTITQQQASIHVDESEIRGMKEVVIAENTEDFRNQLKEQLKSFFVTSFQRTYRGLNYDVISDLVDIMTEDELAEFYFNLQGLEGMSLLDQYYLEYASNITNDFFKLYDDNIDRIIGIPFISSLLDKYQLGTNNQELNDFYSKHDIQVLNHTYEKGDESDFLYNFIEILSKNLGEDNELVRILTFLTSKNYREKGNAIIDVNYEAFIKGYYWLQLQEAYRTGKIDNQVKKELDKYAITKDVSQNNIFDLNLVLSDGTTRTIHNPIGYTANNGTKLRLGMSVDDLNKAGFTVKVLDTITNMNANEEETVASFIAPIDPSADPTIYIVKAINRYSTVTRGIVVFHKVLEQTLKSNPLYKQTDNTHIVSLEDTIQEIYDNRYTTPTTKIAQMINAMHTYGIDINTIQQICNDNFVQQTDIAITVEEPTQLTFGDLIKRDSNGDYLVDKNNHAEVIGNKINIASGFVNVNGANISLRDILDGIANKKQGFDQYADVRISAFDSLYINIKNRANNLDLDTRPATIKSIEGNAKVKVKFIQPGNYTKNSTLAQATKSLQAGTTGNVVLTIGDEFINLLNQLQNNTYTNPYANDSEYIATLKEILQDVGVSLKKNVSNDEILKHSSTIRRVKGVYYYGKHRIKNQKKAASLYAKNRDIQKTNQQLAQEAELFIETMVTQLQKQGAISVRLVFNISNKDARNALIQSFKNKNLTNVEIISSHLQSSLTDEVIEDFLAGSGINLAKIKNKYNKSGRAVVSAILGDGLSDSRADVIISLGGMNAYLAQSLGDRCAVTGLIKTYNEDDTQQAFKDTYEQDVADGKIDPDDGYVGMSNEEDKIFIDTTDAFATAIKVYAQNNNETNMVTAINNLFDASGKNPLFNELQDYTTVNVSEVRKNIALRQELRNNLLKQTITSQQILTSLAYFSDVTNFKTFNLDTSKDDLLRYIYICMLTRDSLINSLQMISYDPKNPSKAFTVEKFLKDNNVTLQENQLNQLKSDVYKALSVLLDEFHAIPIQDKTIQEKNPYRWISYNIKDTTGKTHKIVSKSYLIVDKNSKVQLNTSYLLSAAVVLYNITTQNPLSLSYVANYVDSKGLLKGQNWTDIQQATAFLNQYLNDIQKAYNSVEVPYKDQQSVTDSITALKQEKRGLKSAKNQLAFNEKVQRSIVDAQDIISKTTDNNSKVLLQSYITQAQGQLFDIIQIANSIQKTTSTDVEEQIKHNRLILSVINYIQNYTPTNNNLTPTLKQQLITIDNVKYFDQAVDIRDIRERLDRQLEASKNASKRSKKKKQLKALQDAINNAVTKDELDQAWKDYFAYINGGLLSFKNKTSYLLTKLREQYKLLGNQGILKESFDDDTSVVDALKDYDGIAENILGHYDDLLNQITDPTLRAKAERYVEEISQKNGITLNIHEALNKRNLFNTSGTTLKEDIVVFLTSVAKDEFTKSFLGSINNKLDLDTLTEQQLVQVLMAMIRKNPSLLVLYDIQVDNTSVIHIDMRKELILAAISAGSQTMDQFSSLTDKNPEEVARILGIPQDGDAIAIAKLTKELNKYGVSRENAYRQMGGSLLKTLGLSYNNNKEDAKAFGGILLEASLGRFVVDTLIGMNKDILQHDAGKDPREGKKIPKETLSQIYGKPIARDVSFYKFNQDKAGDVKGLGDYLAVNVFASTGTDFDMFSFDTPIEPKLRAARGSVFRPKIYREKNGQIVYDANGKPEETSQLPQIVEDTIKTLNKTAFSLSYKNVEMLNDIVNNATAYLRNYGYKTAEELANMTEYERLSATGENNSLIQQIEAVKMLLKEVEEYKNKHGKLPDKIYFDWEHIVSGRTQLKGSLFNPQTNKMLRGVLVAQGNYREYDILKKDVLAKEKFAIAQSFDCLDKEGREGVDRLFNDLTEDLADRIYQSLLVCDDKTFERTWSKYGLGVEERTLALQAAYHLKLRAKALASGKNKFQSNLMVEDDSTTSGYFLKICELPQPGIVKNYAIKVGIYDDTTKAYYKNVLGIDLDHVTDIDLLKKTPGMYDIYKQGAITTDEILQNQDKLDEIFLTVDGNGAFSIKSDNVGKTNESLLEFISQNNNKKQYFDRADFIKALPHVEDKNGIKKVSKEFREMLKPIIMIFGYAAGHNGIVNKLGETVYTQIESEIRGYVLKNDVKQFVKNLPKTQIDRLYTLSTIFAWNLCPETKDTDATAPDDGKAYKKGIIVDSGKGQKVEDYIGDQTTIDKTAFKNKKKQAIYENLSKYKLFIELAIYGKKVSETKTDETTGKQYTITRTQTFNPQDVKVRVREKGKTLSYVEAIQNIFAMSYGEAVYEALKQDFEPFMVVNDAINTVAAINTQLFAQAYTEQLDKLLLEVNPKLVGMNVDDKDYEHQRAIALNNITNKQLNNLYMNLYKKGMFPTGPNAVSIMGKQSEADRISGRTENTLGGIQIVEADPRNILLDAIYETALLNETKDAQNNRFTQYVMGQFDVFGRVDFVGSSGLRTAVSTIHSSDFYVLANTILEAAKKGKYVTAIHDAMFMSALDQDVLGKIYNQSALDMGAKYNVLTEYLKWFKSMLRACGYENDIKIAEGQKVSAPKYNELELLARNGNIKAKRKLQQLKLGALYDKQGKYLGTKLSAIGFPLISIKSVINLLGNPANLQEINSAEASKKLTIADVLRAFEELQDKYDNPVYGYRAKFYSKDVTAFNLAGIGTRAIEQGKLRRGRGNQKEVLASFFRPEMDVISTRTLLDAADTSKTGIINLLQVLGANENQDYIQRLTGLLDQFMDMDTLMGWVITQDEVSGNTRGFTHIEEKKIRIQTQKAGNITVGFSQSNAEVYAHELIHALFDFAFSNQFDPRIASYIGKLRLLREYVIKNKLITEDDFYDATNTTDEEAKNTAKKAYDYIFSEESLTDNSLKEFLSFILTNEKVFGKLRNVKIQGQNKKSTLALIFDIVKKLFQTLFGKMQVQTAFEDITKQLSGNMLDNNVTVYESAVKLCLDIKRVNSKAATMLDKTKSLNDSAFGFVNAIKGAGNSLVSPLLKKLVNIPHLSLKLASGTKAEVAAKLIALAPFNKEVRRGLRDYCSMLGRELTGGYINDLINDLKSSDDYSFDMASNSRQVSKIDSVLKQTDVLYQSELRNMFKTDSKGNERPDLTLQEEDALSVLIRGNLQEFLVEDDPKSIDFIQTTLLLDERSRKNYIKTLEDTTGFKMTLTNNQKEAMAKFVRNMAKYEAAIMINAKGTTFFSSYDNGYTMVKKAWLPIYNATGIRMDETFQKSLGQRINKLASLYYLQEIHTKEPDKLLTLSKLSDIGIKTYLETHKSFVETAKKNDNGSINKLEHQRENGIVPAAKNYSVTADIQMAPLSQKDVMIYNGYKYLNDDLMVNNTNDELAQYEGMKLREGWGLFVRDVFVPTRIDGAGIALQGLKDTSISLDKVLTETFDLEEDVKQALEEQVANSYQGIIDTDIATQKEIANRDKKSFEFRNTLKLYSDKMFARLLSEDVGYTELENTILTSQYDGTRLRPYNYKDAVTKLYLDDNGIKLLSKMLATQDVCPAAYSTNKALIEILQTYFEDNSVLRGGKYIDRESGLHFLDIKEQLVKRYGSGVADLIKDNKRFYVREDMIKAILGVESWSITTAKKSDGKNIIPPQFLKAATYLENLMRLTGFKSKENTVIRNPKVVLGNIISNINIHLLTDSNLPKIMGMYARNTQATYTYLKQQKRQRVLQLKQRNKTLTQEEARELARINSELENSIVSPLMREGMFTNIVEDISTLEQENMADITQQLANLEVIKKTPKGMKNIFRQAYMLKGTPIYNMMYHLNQYSDFVARCTEYQLQMEKYKDLKTINPELFKRREKEVFNDIWDKFIDYRMPVNKVEQYLNDIGMIQFAKYFRRIQRVIMRVGTVNPVGCLMQLARQFTFGETENIFTSNVFAKNYDALFLGPEQAAYNTALPGLAHFFGLFKYRG